MADAEVKLNFTAEIKEAENQLKTLRELIDWVAEDLSIIVSKSKEFGPFSPETVDSVRVLSEELERMRGQYDMLQQQFTSLQASASTMSVHFLEELQEWKKALNDQIEYTKEQAKQIKGLNDLVENQGKQIESLRKANKRTTEDGIHGYVSLRSALTRFITQLARGKVAVVELGVALKGLAYSSVILGAVQLAMDGIGFAWEKIKGVFGKSKEEMEAAEEAAKRAQEQLKEAQEAAAAAEKAYAEWKDKLDKDNAAKELSDRVEKIAGLFQKQREELDRQLGLVMVQAELEDRMLKDKEAQERHEIALQRLELKRKLLMEEISKEQYDSGVAKLDRRVQGLDNQAKVDAASAALKKIESEKRALLEAYGTAYVGRDEALEKRRGMVSDKDVEGARLAMEADKAQLDLAEKRFNKLKDEAKGGDFEFDIGADGKVDYKRSSLTYLNDVLGNGDYMKEIERAVKELNNARYNARQGELKYNRALAGNEGWKENEAYLERQKKLMDEIVAKKEKLDEMEKNARRRLKDTEETTFIDSLRQDEIFDAAERVRTAEAVAKKRKAAKKPAKVSGALKDAVKQIVKDAKTAYNTDGDRTDDAEVMRAVAELLRNNRSEIGGYKDGLKELLTVCSMLKVKGDSNSAELARLRTEIKSLKRRTSQQ